MATCRDCLGCEWCCSCDDYYLPGLRYHELENVEKHCDSFKDAKHHLYVPCVVGDTVYWVTNTGFIRHLTVTHVDIKLRKNESDIICRAVFDLDGKPCEMAIPPSKFGEIYFVNPEDAQKVLKERESRNEV